MNTSNSSTNARDGVFSRWSTPSVPCQAAAKRLALVLCLVGLALPALGGSGDFSKSLVSTPPVEDEWQFSVGLYGWLPDIKGSTVGGYDIDISQSDILDTLEGLVMADFGARKGKWAIGTDVIYVDLEDDTGRESLREIDLTAWVITPSISYTVLEGDWGNLDVLAGARYLYLKAGLDFQGILGNRSASADQWDAIGGFMGKINLPNRWYIPYYFDIGGGSSDLTYQVAAGVGRHIGENWDVLLVYRYLDYDLDGAVLDDLNVRGPLIGVRYKF